MESKAQFLGHPLHPMLIVFPLGLLATAVIFDAIYPRSPPVGTLECRYAARLDVEGYSSKVYQIDERLYIVDDYRTSRFRLCAL